HEVLIAAPRSSFAHVARARLPFAGVDDPPVDEIEPILERVRASDDPDQIVLDEIFLGSFPRAAYPGMLALVRRGRPDVILRASLVSPSLLAPEVVGVPVIEVECFLSSPSRPLPLEALRDEFGVRAGAHDARYLTLSPASLDSGRDGALRFRVPVE